MGLWSRWFGAAPPPSKPAIVAHQALGGVICVFEVPTSPGWQHEEEERPGDGFTAMREQFIVSALGSPSAFAQHAAEIDRWFDTSAFVPLGSRAH